MNSVPPCVRPALRADLKAYLDNELSALRKRAVAAHLRQCESCRQEIREMEKIASNMKAANPAAVLTQDLRARLLTQVATEGGKPASSVPTSRVLPLWRRQPVLVFGSGAVSVALFMTIFLPTLAKERREQTVVSSRAQLGLATLGYVQEYDAKFPTTEGFVRARPEFSAPASEVVPQLQVAQAERRGDEVANGAVVDGKPVEAQKADTAVADDGRQVHKEGSITVAVDRLEETSDKVEEMVKASDGYVASNELSTDASGYKSADLTVRIPVAQFEDMMKKFANLGNVTAKNISGEDITEKLSDSNQAVTVLSYEVEASAAKLRSFGGSDKERRYREADLRQAKIQLAQEQARLGLLRKMARLATINVSLTEKAKRTAAAPTSGFMSDLGATNRAASAAFQAAIRVPVILIIWVLAFSPLWIPLVILYRYASLKSLAQQTKTLVKPEATSETA